MLTRSWLLLVMASACSGTSGARDHAHKDVLANHCSNHTCGPDVHVESLGDGCYAVDSRLYQCSPDTLPVGQLLCLDVTPCTGLCKMTITVGDREVDIDHCRPKWESYLRAKHPLTCSPVPVAMTGFFTAMPKTFDLPPELVVELMRSGKDRVVYETAVCALKRSTTVGAPTRSTGIDALDRWLADRLRRLDPSRISGSCRTLTLVLGPFDCDVEAISL